MPTNKAAVKARVQRTLTDARMQGEDNPGDIKCSRTFYHRVIIDIELTEGM